MSEVRGSGIECQAAMAQNGQEELPHVQGQGRCLRPRAAAGKSKPTPEGSTATRSSNPKPKARGGGREGQPHVQGVVAVQAQEGLEEPSHLKVRKGSRRRYPSSKVRSSSCALLEQP